MWIIFIHTVNCFNFKRNKYDKRSILGFLLKFFTYFKLIYITIHSYGKTLVVPEAPPGVGHAL